jgi:ubiquinone/menaquinone biosynthesis C-methylase UbiE
MSTVLQEQCLAPNTGMHPPPSPAKFVEAMQAYQRTAAMKTAIELELFTLVGDGSKTVDDLAQVTNASRRGVHALCDFLVIMGFLTKVNRRYGLTADSAVFLDKKSPAYVGTATKFFASPFVMENFTDLESIVRSGGPRLDRPSFEREHPVWVDFARGMAPLLQLVAEETAKLVHVDSATRVLDIAAGHGLFGISVARRNPDATIVALDSQAVLAIAQENAERLGVSDRYTLLPGDALEVPYGKGYGVVLVPNFLHHFDREAIRIVLKKIHGALAPGGRVVVVEFVPNDDRVSPPVAAGFVLNVLANTRGGDAYSLSEYRAMFQETGFSLTGVYPLPPTPETALIAAKS